VAGKAGPNNSALALLEKARVAFNETDNCVWLEWGALLMPRLQKVAESEAAVATQNEQKKLKEEKIAAIMAQFKQDAISADDAAKGIEGLDVEFGADEDEPILGSTDLGDVHEPSFEEDNDLQPDSEGELSMEQPVQCVIISYCFVSGLMGYS
jgi:hypothetical protein